MTGLFFVNGPGMDEVVDKIYKGFEVDWEELSLVAKELGMKISQPEVLLKDIAKEYQLSEGLSNWEAQLLLAYKYTNKETEAVKRILSRKLNTNTISFVGCGNSSCIKDKDEYKNSEEFDSVKQKDAYGNGEKQNCSEGKHSQSVQHCMDDVSLLKSGTSDEIAQLRLELASVTFMKNKLSQENNLLSKELEALKNEYIDREYENGLFIEDDVLRKIEEENCRLKNLTEGVYTDVINVWFGLVKDKLIKKDD